MSVKQNLEKKVAILIKKLNITDVELATSVPLLQKQLEGLQAAEKAQDDADTEQAEAEVAQDTADDAKDDVKAKPAPKPAPTPKPKKLPTKKGYYVAELAAITGRKGKLFEEGQEVRPDQLAGGQEALDHLIKRKKVIHVK